MPEDTAPHEGQILRGSLFNEPMRVETVRAGGDGTWVLGLVGVSSERFRKVTLSADGPEGLTVTDTRYRYDGDGRLFRLGLQAYALGIAYEFDPYFGLSISRVDPLPHQLEAVYDYLLKLARVRFLLADDAGAGKTIMAGLLIRELELRGLAERIMIVCPANLAFQWQRELKEKVRHEVLSSSRPGHPRPVRREPVARAEEGHHLARSGQTGRHPARAAPGPLGSGDRGRGAPHVLDADESRKSLRYKLGELLRDTSDHLLLLTATPHKGDPENFTLFLQLLDADCYADVNSIREAMNRRTRAVLPAPHQGGDGLFPRTARGRHLGRRKIFTKRIPAHGGLPDRRAGVRPYRDVTRFVKRQSARRPPPRGGPARARGRLPDVPLPAPARLEHLRHAAFSLENRARRLEEGLKRAQDLTRQAPPDLPIRKRWRKWRRASATGWRRCSRRSRSRATPNLVHEEVQELREPGRPGPGRRRCGHGGQALGAQGFTQKEGFFDHADQRLLLFTEFKDTLDYLMVASRPGASASAASTGHEVGLARRAGHPASTPSSSSGKARSRSWSPPRRRARASTSRSATSSSTTTSPGTRTASSSGWAHPPLRPAQGLPDLQLRGHQHHRRPVLAAAARKGCRRSATPSTTTPSSTSSARSCLRPTSSACCATTTPGSSATPTSKSACSAMSTRGSSAPSARTPWKDSRARSSTSRC